MVLGTQGGENEYDLSENRGWEKNNFFLRVIRFLPPDRRYEESEIERFATLACDMLQRYDAAPSIPRNGQHSEEFRKHIQFFVRMPNPKGAGQRAETFLPLRSANTIASHFPTFVSV